MPVNFYMDLSKAFDSLSHDILLNKLTYYGVKNSTTDLLRSYLPNRKQYVQIDDISSSIVSINTGVPQGSVVGPLLINIFINDIIMSSDKFNFILCTDDATLNATVEYFVNPQLIYNSQSEMSYKKYVKMVGSKQVASKRCKIEVHAFPHTSESNSTVTFFPQWISY